MKIKAAFIIIAALSVFYFLCPANEKFKICENPYINQNVESLWRYKVTKVEPHGDKYTKITYR